MEFTIKVIHAEICRALPCLQILFKLKAKARRMSDLQPTYLLSIVKGNNSFKE